MIDTSASAADFGSAKPKFLAVSGVTLSSKAASVAFIEDGSLGSVLALTVYTLVDLSWAERV